MKWEEVKDILMKVDTTCISDALKKLSISGHMSYKIRPLFSCKMIGPAVTIKRVPAQSNLSQSEFSKHSMALQEVTDNAPEGSVVVVSSQGGGDNCATWGGLLSTGAQMKKLAGSVVDGGTRDKNEIIDMGYPVFSTSVVPSSAVGKLVTIATNVPIDICGVWVHPGDIIVGDDDGVVVIPKDKLEEVANLALEIFETEEKMSEFLRNGGSLVEAVKTYRQR